MTQRRARHPIVHAIEEQLSLIPIQHRLAVLEMMVAIYQARVAEEDAAFRLRVENLQI